MAGRISRVDAIFNSYINNTSAYLSTGGPPTNGVRLGLTAGEVTDWATFRGDWNSSYASYTNPDTNTKTIKDTKNAIKRNFITFASPLLDRMATSTAITLADRNTLNIKERDTTPSARPAIGTEPSVKGKSKPGANILLECRVESDSSRTSRHPDSDGAEVCFIVGTAPPRNPAECTRRQVSKKARITLELDIADAGKKFFGYVRWVNLSEPSKNGPWSQLVTLTITE
jgi:hypothetical protein